MLTYGFNYLAPSISELAMYSQFLAIAEQSHHVPPPAAPLSPKDILNICRFIDHNQPISPAIKAAILLANATFLRVSIVLSPSTQQLCGPHTLQARDVIVIHPGIKVIVRSTKTRRGREPHVIDVFPSPSPHACPVRASNLYNHLIRPCPIGPAFMLDYRTPLTPGPVVSLIRQALSAAGYRDSTRFSFHLLCRGGAQIVLLNGAPEAEIMHHGTWSSKAGITSYIKRSPQIVPSILAGALAN